MGGFWKLRALLVLAGTCLVLVCFGQSSTGGEETEIRLHSAAGPAACSGSVPTNAVEAATRQEGSFMVARAFARLIQNAQT